MYEKSQMQQGSMVNSVTSIFLTYCTYKILTLISRRERSFDDVDDMYNRDCPCLRISRKDSRRKEIGSSFAFQLLEKNERNPLFCLPRSDELVFDGPSDNGSATTVLSDIDPLSRESAAKGALKA